jgi:hypothetical protein
LRELNLKIKEQTYMKNKTTGDYFKNSSVSDNYTTQPQKDLCATCKFDRVGYCDLTASYREDKNMRKCLSYLSQPKESWEGRFDEEFVNGARLGGVYARTVGDKVKLFIKNLLEEQKEEIINTIEKHAMTNADSGWYDKAITDVIKLIKGL